MARKSILSRVLDPSFWSVKLTDWKYALTASLWKQKTPRFFRVKHGKLFLEPSEGFRTFLRAHDMWEPKVRQKLYHIIRPGEQILDLGSNYGEFALQMADLAGPTGKVVGVEPDPHYHPILALLKEYNPGLASRMTFLAAGISEEQDLNWISKHGKIMPTFYFSDIEGAERILFQQLFASPKWLKNSPRMLIELHPEVYGEKVEQEIMEKLTKAGYHAEEVDYKHYYFWR